MAIITPSALISEIAGSVGTQCFGRNLGGAYVRAKPVVPYQRTFNQGNWRNKMITVVALWRGLTDAQRNVYNQAAIDYGTNERLGQSQPINGYNLFLRQQLRLGNLGTPPGFRNPSPKLNSSYSVALTTCSPSSLLFTITKFGTQSNVYYMVKLSKQLSAGIQHPNAHAMLIIITNTIASGSTTQDIIGTYTGLFGAPVSGKRIAFAFSTLHADTGEATDWQQLSKIVA